MPAATSFVLGYHGCDYSTAQRVLEGKEPLRESHNDYDWLGDGIYFWEHNAERAYQFARDVRDRGLRKPRIRRPAVIGTVIDLGLCLNLLDGRFISMVRRAYDDLAQSCLTAGAPLPRNSLGADLLLRRLDCAVIRFLHQARQRASEEPFDTVRAAFVEGDRLYENAGFSAKNHIQICVRQVSQIKGYFRPLDAQGRAMKFS